MLIKRAPHAARHSTLATSHPIREDKAVYRRSFLCRSGLATGSLAALGTLPLTAVRKVEAGPPRFPAHW
jgi:formate dehydrogenase major subunit